VKKEVSEEEAEEKFHDDDLGEDGREHFIKGDGFEDDSEDIVEEEMMKQDEAPKNREDSKKELREGVLEAKSDENKGEEDPREYRVKGEGF
jgi:hypothetical protein